MSIGGPKPMAIPDTDADDVVPSALKTTESDSTSTAESPEVEGPSSDESLNDTDPPKEHSAIWLRHSDRVVLVVSGSLILLFTVLHWGRMSGWGQKEIEVSRLPQQVYDYRVDVNKATWVEWMQLEGIGEVLARRIVADQEENGPFESVDDIARVRGIGPKKLEAIRPWLDCNQ